MEAPKPDDWPRIAGVVPLLAAADVQATAAYYRDYLGFEVMVIYPGAWVRLRRGTAELQIEQSDTIGHIGYGEKGGVALQVEDVDEWFREMQRRGAKFDQGPMNQQYGWRDFSVIDPNGYRLVFWQPLGAERPGHEAPAS